MVLVAGEFIRIPFPVSGPLGRDPRFARGGGRLGWAWVVEPGADDAAVSAVGPDLWGHGAVGGAVSGGSALAACGLC